MKTFLLSLAMLFVASCGDRMVCTATDAPTNTVSDENTSSSSEPALRDAGCVEDSPTVAHCAARTGDEFWFFCDRSPDIGECARCTRRTCSCSAENCSEQSLLDNAE